MSSSLISDISISIELDADQNREQRSVTREYVVSCHCPFEGVLRYALDLRAGTE
jgi:hypothetical protein